MPERRAKDIMVPIGRYASVSIHDNLRHAIKVLRSSLSSGYRSLAVMDEEGNLVGFLTTRTLLNALSIYGLDEDLETADSWGTFFIRLEKERLKDVRVGKIMRPVREVFVEQDTPLPEVARVILSSQVNHVPVLDENKRVIGIVRTIDILDVLAELMEPPR
ncbi:CBS domain-containing protein [Desulfovirgula thermocuniculi]|uniref:CBS domain-containing protein n=1 Tax=Desulfovirgula thermocuniculi TaxID=348842 RepID=UPI00041ADEB9|nr:CBS domain-containing protein [Desulfovirgula thermocuniculi]